MNDHDELLNDIAALALGVVSHADAVRIRQHLLSCEECRKHYREFAAIADAFGVAMAFSEGDESTRPSPELRKRVYSITRSAPFAKGRRFNAAAAALLVIVLSSSVIAVILGMQDARLHHDVAVSLHRNAVLSQQNARDSMLIADLADASAQHFAVPNGTIVRRGDRLYMVLHGMPNAPAGKVYQAWLLRNGMKRVTASLTFTPDRGRVVLLIPGDARNVAAVAVSIEPAGGSVQPTSTPAFVVKLVKA